MGCVEVLVKVCGGVCQGVWRCVKVPEVCKGVKVRRRFVKVGVWRCLLKVCEGV